MQEFFTEEEFYESWSKHIENASSEELMAFNQDKLSDINSSCSNMLLWLKSAILQELASRGV